MPNTMMPLTSIMGWSLRPRNLVAFFLQSRTKVTFFLWMLSAILCHLYRNGQPGRAKGALVTECQDRQPLHSARDPRKLC